MSEVVDGEVAEQEPLPKLTVKQFLEDLAKFPQESEIVAALYGIGMTMPIFQAVQVNADGKELTVLQVSAQAAAQALEYGMQQAQAKQSEGSEH